jgi:hypothetical protein
MVFPCAQVRREGRAIPEGKISPVPCLDCHSLCITKIGQETIFCGKKSNHDGESPKDIGQDSTGRLARNDGENGRS